MSFEYNSGPIEVFVVTNDDGTVNGYAEVSAVANLLMPYTRLTSAQLWNTTHNTYRIQNNNKSFIHAIVICKYLSAVPESDNQNYQHLRQLVRDLIVGDQKEVMNDIKEDLLDIKNKLADHQPDLLGDLNALLHVVKSEIVSEIKGLLEPPPVSLPEEENNIDTKE